MNNWLPFKTDLQLAEYGYKNGSVSSLLCAAEFMSRMYKKVKAGMTYAEAYRKVKNEFRNSDEYYHPYYWAAFAIYE